MSGIVTWLGAGMAMFRAPATADEPAGWRLRTADGGMLAVGLAADADLAAVAAHNPDDADRRSTDPGATDDFARQAALGGFGPPDPSPITALTVGLSAPEPFAAALRAALVDRGAGPVDVVAEVPPAAGASIADCRSAVPDNRSTTGLDALISVSDGPTPPAWLDLDGQWPTGFAWFRAGIEGWLAHLEPPTIGPDPVTHRAVRARRLATAQRPVEQSAYWAGPRWAGPIGYSAAAVHLLAELLVRDVESWAGGTAAATAGEPPLHRRLRLLDLQRLRWTDHPILPLPPSTDWRDGR